MSRNRIALSSSPNLGPKKRFARRLLSAGFLTLLLSPSAGCSKSPPPNWQIGGARLVLPVAASWERPGDDPIQILQDGQVLEDGELLWVVDIAGRVVNEDHEPVAILLPDGFVAGNNNQLLGRVGVANASAPGAAYAWLAVRPDGSVLFYEADGEPYAGGAWRGCEGMASRTCTLVTHLIHLRKFNSAPRTRVGIGIGFGF